jgi:hypothetical protein
MANWYDQTMIGQFLNSNQHLIFLRFTHLLLSLKQQVSRHQWVVDRTVSQTEIDLLRLCLSNAISAVADIGMRIAAFLEQLNTELFVSVIVVQVRRVEVALLEMSKRFFAETRPCWVPVCFRRQFEFCRIHAPAPVFKNFLMFSLRTRFAAVIAYHDSQSAVRISAKARRAHHSFCWSWNRTEIENWWPDKTILQQPKTRSTSWRIHLMKFKR